MTDPADRNAIPSNQPPAAREQGWNPDPTNVDSVAPVERLTNKGQRRLDTPKPAASVSNIQAQQYVEPSQETPKTDRDRGYENPALKRGRQGYESLSDAERAVIAAEMAAEAARSAKRRSSY